MILERLLYEMKEYQEEKFHFIEISFIIDFFYIEHFLFNIQ